MTTRAQVMTTIGSLVQNMTFASAINGKTSWANKVIDPASGAPAKLKLWEAVSSDQQPAAFLVTHQEEDEYRNLGLVRRRLRLGIWCYSRADSAPGAPDLDIMMQGFEGLFGINAMDNFSTGAVTLGGLVYWCRIEGKVFKDPGDIDSQAMLICPLTVEMP